MIKSLITAGLVLILSGCGDFGNPLTEEVEQTPAAVQAVFDGNCLGCHGSSGDLNLAEAVSFQNLVDIPASGYAAARVLPGVPDSSVLWHKISGSGVYGPAMPIGGSLTHSELDIIFDWISDGAPPR